MSQEQPTSSLRQQFSDLLKDEAGGKTGGEGTTSMSPAPGEASSYPSSSLVRSPPPSAGGGGTYLRVILALVVVGLIAVLVKHYDRIKEYAVSLLSTVTGKKATKKKGEGKTPKRLGETAAGKATTVRFKDEEEVEDEGSEDPMFQPFPEE